MAQEPQRWGSQSAAPLHWAPPAVPNKPQNPRPAWLLALAGGATALLMSGVFLLVDGGMPALSRETRDSLLFDAQTYVDNENLSRESLIEELEFDGYSTTDAQWAADNVNVDWHLEASGVAAEALVYSAFSEEGLIEFLEYDGFTRKQAEFAVSDQTIDWSEQAVILANSYVDVGIDTREAMIDQLLYEGFSQSDAEYGATAVGLR